MEARHKVLNWLNDLCKQVQYILPVAFAFLATLGSLSVCMVTTEGYAYVAATK